MLVACGGLILIRSGRLESQVRVSLLPPAPPFQEVVAIPICPAPGGDVGTGASRVECGGDAGRGVGLGARGSEILCL